MRSALFSDGKEFKHFDSYTADEWIWSLIPKSKHPLTASHKKKIHKRQQGPDFCSDFIVWIKKLHTNFTDEKKINVIIKLSSLAIKVLKTMLSVNSYKFFWTDIAASLSVETAVIMGIVLNHERKKWTLKKDWFFLWKIAELSLSPKLN